MNAQNDTLTRLLMQDRRASYYRLRGGFPVLFAGATYWGVLTAAGYFANQYTWFLIALLGSGAIFPAALFYSKVFRIDFMQDRTSVTSVLLPAFIAMLLFWPMAIAALWEAPAIFPLIMAIGLSLHFPVIGWAYGRTAIYSAHALFRAIIVFVIWWKLPEHRLTLLPLSVTAIYLLTALIVVVDSNRFRDVERPVLD
ncbi:hypothetical protein ABFZ85_02215 [Hyphococcus formosus]|uniref:DUF7010 family protein n=1 Tax=Hyphococcus formosus TaxID=3143534 RepID=UPI00398A98A9